MPDYPYSEVVELRGHIIDSMILPQIMDEIMSRGGEFDVQELDVGRHKEDPSYARLEIRASSEPELGVLLDVIGRLGAAPVRIAPAQTAPAPADGVFPDNFYSTTNLQTMVNAGGRWLNVEYPEMDCAILLDEDRGSARSVTLGEVRQGDDIVVGNDGIRVIPIERPRSQPPVFA